MARNSASSAAALSFTPHQHPAQRGARGIGELARVVGVHHQPERFVARQRVGQRLGDQRRIGHGHARVHAQGLDMRDRRQRRDDLAQPAWRKQQRIAAAQDHLADRRAGAQPVVRGLQLDGAQQPAVRADLLAAEAEAAIHRAGQQRLQQGAVGITMHHALDRRERLVADRIEAFV
jgi:hypothetical protein